MPNTLYQPKDTKGNANDPFMINPKGFKVQVPETSVRDLLSKGFVLVDKTWKPSNIEAPKPNIERDYPQPLNDLKKEVSKELDLLEATEI